VRARVLLGVACRRPCVQVTSPSHLFAVVATGDAVPENPTRNKAVVTLGMEGAVGTWGAALS
jgi:hypothetical protein